MGREIRRVPPNWQHPEKDYPDYRSGRMEKGYQPLYDRPFAPEMDEWYAEWKSWENGTHPDKADNGEYTFWEWHGSPPDPIYHRPDWPEGTATWWQVYETVSEGTPVTPPFSTPEELIDYLATNGDFWDQKRGDGPWSRANAEAFVRRGWASSLVVMGGTVHAPRDGVPATL